MPETQTPTQEPQAVRTCTGDCKQCGYKQHAYCAAKIGYNIQNYLVELAAGITALKESVARLESEVQEAKERESSNAVIEAPAPTSEPPRKPKPKKERGTVSE